MIFHVLTNSFQLSLTFFCAVFYEFTTTQSTFDVASLTSLTLDLWQLLFGTLVVLLLLVVVVVAGLTVSVLMRSNWKCDFCWFIKDTLQFTFTLRDGVECGFRFGFSYSFTFEFAFWFEFTHTKGTCTRLLPRRCTHEHPHPHSHSHSLLYSHSHSLCHSFITAAGAA